MDRIEHGSRTILHAALRRMSQRKAPSLPEMKEALGVGPAENAEPQEFRSDLVARLRTEVEAGTYRPDPRQVAQAMLKRGFADELALLPFSH